MIAFFDHHRERSFKTVPKWVIGLLAISLVVQVGWRLEQPPPSAQAEMLPHPPEYRRYNILSFAESSVLAKLTMLWLQAFDNQPGISLPFRALDYQRVREWLTVILQLDERAQFPLLAASRIYGEVIDPPRQKLMLEFVHEMFLVAPNRRWPWLAHAVYLAKHRLNDKQLALKYAHSLRLYATGDSVPHWAKQLEIYVLEDLGELESARILIGGLLDSGTLKDEHEREFLQKRLQDLILRQPPE